MDKEFDNEPVYGDNDKYKKTKIKTYRGKIITNVQGIKIPKENASFKCWSFITLDSVIKVNKKYNPQTLLEECKYEIKTSKMENLVNDDLEPSLSDDETENDSDSESDNDSDNE